MAKKPKKAQYDVDEVRRYANGNWQRLLARAGFDPDLLDGRPHPCPKRCSPDGGGKDRFRFTNLDGDGSIICNQCGRDIGNGFQAIEWLDGRKFGAVLPWAAGELGIEPSKNGSHKKGEDVDPAANLAWQPWNGALVGLWCLWKPPITPEAIQRVGGRIARYYGSYTVIALPIWGPKLNEAEPVGWCLYNITGGMLPKNMRDASEGGVKVKLAYGSGRGWIGPVEKLKAASSVWKLEGPSDLLGFYSLANIPENEIALTNACGAKEMPLAWMLESLAGKSVTILHDADEPGQEGATGYVQKGVPHAGWLEMVSAHAADVYHAKLPYEVGVDHGKDLRDYLSENIQDEAV